MASKLIGAIVGTFKVGTGVKVGPPTFQPDKPKITLKGGPFVTRVLGDLQSIPMGKGRMTLVAKHYDYASAYSVGVPGTPKIILKGKAFEPKLPDKQAIATPRITLKAKGFIINKSASMQIGKPKLLLKGKTPGKVGKAGLVPLVPTEIYGTPSVPREKLLVPTAAYPSELLVPTTVKVI